jgi:hypothetical protein
VSLDVSINLASLSIIQEELSNTLTHAATDFEAHMANGSDQTDIQSCREGIAQVGGTFRLIEYPGAALLADEMALLVDVIVDEERKTTDAMVNALIHSFFVLPRYIEFISIRESELPTIVIPYVNELRVGRRVDLLSEHHFYQGSIPTMGLMDQTSEEPNIKLLLASLPRLQSMYQAGLVGVIKEPDSSLHYLFMGRSVSRITKLLGNHAQAEVWQLAGLVLNAFGAGDLEMTINRKRNLATLEKQMRSIVTKGEQGLVSDATAELKKDLLFMLMLTSYSGEGMAQLRAAYSLPDLGISDNDIRAQRDSMHGPSLDTLESVIKVMTEEVRYAKDILEIGSQNAGVESEDLATLIETVARISDTLNILNLSGPKATLDEQLTNIRQWQAQMDGTGLTRSDFQHAADCLLYIESALASLDRREVSVDDLNKANVLARKKIVASSQLAQANQLVLEEAQAGIALAKRAITSYVEANFDIAHISNVGTTLNTVWGGLHMLNYNRAASVIKSCGAFVASHIDDRQPGEQRYQLLETLADALISLEYYLNELTSRHGANEKVLEIAEQSLAALGFAVEPLKSE